MRFGKPSIADDWLHLLLVHEGAFGEVILGVCENPSASTDEESRAEFCSDVGLAINIDGRE